MAFILAIRRHKCSERANIPRSQRLSGSQPATSTTRYLGQPQAAALQTPERDRILCSSRICCFPPIKRKLSSIFKIHLATATAILPLTIQLRILIRRRGIIPHSISGALRQLNDRRRHIRLPRNRISGSKTGRVRPPGVAIKAAVSASDTDALQFCEYELRISLRSCAPRLRRGDWDFALRLSRSRTRGISLHRIRASGLAPG